MKFNDVLPTVRSLLTLIPEVTLTALITMLLMLQSGRSGWKVEQPRPFAAHCCRVGCRQLSEILGGLPRGLAFYKENRGVIPVK